jgi:hypothetical protein
MSEAINNVIIGLISKNTDPNKNKFDVLMQNIENYIEGGKAHTMSHLKEKANNKKKKGDLFESFCCLYLRHVLDHDEVWFYKDFPKELKEQFHLPNNDYGIDLISKKGDGYYAIQCKYRRPQEKTQVIPWKSLSTFYAMVVKSGPWVKHITMTNVNGCRHIGEKTDKDWSICIGTFRNINHFSWLKICNGAPITEPIVAPDRELLRNKRLEFLNKLGNLDTTATST